MLLLNMCVFALKMNCNTTPKHYDWIHLNTNLKIIFANTTSDISRKNIILHHFINVE